ncbi:cyclic nucleotide-binding domain-containing protein, partial [Gemmatimonadota bacterium]
EPMSNLEKSYITGEVIIKEGQESKCFYIIKPGKAEVVRIRDRKKVVLDVLGPNDFFGELSLLDPEHRQHSATIRALEETVVIIMDKEHFKAYLGDLSPGVMNLLRKMAQRLRKTSQMVTLAKEKESLGNKEEEPNPSNSNEQE